MGSGRTGNLDGSTGNRNANAPETGSTGNGTTNNIANNTAASYYGYALP